MSGKQTNYHIEVQKYADDMHNSSEIPYWSLVDVFETRDAAQKHIKAGLNDGSFDMGQYRIIRLMDEVTAEEVTETKVQFS